MNNIQKRFLLFLLGCIGLRVLLVFISKNIKPKYLQIMGYIAIIPALGFILIYLLNLRKTGRETIGGKIWWNNLRPIHGILYLLFAYNAINRNRDSWQYLLIDVVIGLIAFIIYHYQNNNFKLLL